MNSKFHRWSKLLDRLSEDFYDFLLCFLLAFQKFVSTVSPVYCVLLGDLCFIDICLSYPAWFKILFIIIVDEVIVTTLCLISFLPMNEMSGFIGSEDERQPPR